MVGGGRSRQAHGIGDRDTLRYNNMPLGLPFVAEKPWLSPWMISKNAAWIEARVRVRKMESASEREI